MARLIDDLAEIEGAAGNLRGAMFELITAYLVRNDGGSVDVGLLARDPATGRVADIDVIRVRKDEVTAFECKGKRPGGNVSIDEVEEWLSKIPTFRSHLARQERFREMRTNFELWTTGQFTEDALAKLKLEKQRRVKNTIDWKDGAAVADIAKRSREKKIKEALFEHFLHHPLAKA
jgi:Holliday junction resolvase